MDLVLQLVIILVCLFYGARKGGVALGLLGGIGIVILVFAFKLPPGKPPVEVMLTIIAVVLSLLVGTTVLMSSIVFSFQRYFEYQIEEARKISQ